MRNGAVMADSLPLLEAHGAGLTLAALKTSLTPNNVSGEDPHVLVNRCSYVLYLASLSTVVLC